MDLAMNMWDESIKRKLKHCGENVFIGQHCVFTNPSEVVLQDCVRIDPFGLFTTALEVNPYSHICSHVALIGGASYKITLHGSNFIGYGSKILCATEDYTGEFGPIGEYWFDGNKLTSGNVEFKKFSGVASNCIVFPGVILPAGCAIGEGSKVQKKNYLVDWSIYYGRPLCLRGTRKQIEGKLKDKWISAK